MEKSVVFEVIISTCNKFSDLWDAHVMLLNQNWKSRGKTYLVTDDATDRRFEGVEVVCAGEGAEITKRLECALKKVSGKYVLFTLDDYFLTEPIDTDGLNAVIRVMEEENLDYVRLYAATESALRKEDAMEITNHPGFYLRNLDKGNYKISLYPGIWRTDFMRATLCESMNAWQYEVSLTPMARQLNARCAISNHQEFPFLDVVRKGKILRKANRYFQKNPIYHSQREVLSVPEELKFRLRAYLHYQLPKPVMNLLKRILRKFGVNFYSPVR